MSILSVYGGYTAIETPAYTVPHDHPSMVAALGVVRGERRDRLIERITGPESRRADRIPRQRAVAGALTDEFRVDMGGQLDIRADTAMLCALAGDAIILADRQRQLAVAGPALRLQVLVQGIEVLHGALAEGLLADDHAAGVILDRGRHGEP